MKFTKDMFCIAYLFLHCNGSIEAAEEEKFSGFVDMYNEAVDDYDKIESEDIRSGANDLLEENSNVRKCIFGVIDENYFDYEEKVSLLWLLVSMAYADGNCDTVEENLLQRVFGKLALEDDTILLELKDTAETLLAIERKLDTIRGTKCFAVNMQDTQVCSPSHSKESGLIYEWSEQNNANIYSECKKEQEYALSSVEALTTQGE